MVNLDDRDAIIKLQGGEDTIHSIDGLSNQLDQSWQESQQVEIPKSYQKISNIVICGMGGSRFPALIVKSLFKEELKVPLVVNDNYTLPGFVDNNTLVILSSYSGTTEEVLSCADEAIKRKAKLAGVTAGGDIEKLLKEKKAPVYVFNPIYNPSNSPRMGGGYGIGGLLGILFKANLIKFDPKILAEAIINLDELLKNNKIDVLFEENPAKQMAKNIFGRYPYYVVSEFLEGVGNGAQNQTNETAKAISSYRVLPELNHHLMEGLKFPKEHVSMAIFIFFYSNLYSESMQKRFHITKDVIEQNKIEPIWCELSGKNKVEQVFELLGFGGYMTMYLSVLYEQDPVPNPWVDYFKKNLKNNE